MKQLLAFLAAMLLLFSLSACAQKPPAPKEDSEAAPPSAAEPIVLEELCVEFVKGERDTDALVRLKKELPPLLISALAAEGVTVNAVSVTFGASAEATAQALSSGSVHVGFLPTSVYCAHFGEMHAVADRTGADDTRIGLYLPYADYNAALLEKLTSIPWGTAFAQADLTAARWALPALDDRAERYLSLLLEENYSLSLSELENVSYYSDLAERDTALKNANFIILYGAPAVTNNFFATLETLPLEGETVAVTAAEETVQSDKFRTALQNALAALCLDESAQPVLALYCGGEYADYRAVNDGVYAAQRRVLGCTEE